MMSTNLTENLFKVISGNKSSVFHFKSGNQSERFRVVLFDRQIHWNSIHTDTETVFVV